MSVSPISFTVPALSSRERGVQGGAPPPRVEPQAGAPPPEVAEPRAPERDTVTEEAQMRSALAAANQHFREQAMNLQYSMDEDTRKMVIKLVDSESGEVIRQIPSEEMLAIARALDRAMSSGSGFAIQTQA